MTEDGDIRTLLASLDHEAPDVTADDIAERARRAPRDEARHEAVPEADDRPRPSTLATPALRLAAGLALALGLAGIAWALPGSPVRAWVDAILAPGPEAAPVSPAHSPTAPGAGVEVGPGAGVAGVVLDAAAPVRVVVEAGAGGAGGSGGVVDVLLTPDGDLTASATAGRASFTSEPDRLRVTLAGADTLRLRVPATARRVEVRAAGRVIFSKTGDDIVAAAPPIAPGRYLLPLGPDER